MKCKWPLNHISISSTGVYRPCCAWEEQPNQVSVTGNTTQDYLQSDMYKNLITALNNDKFGVGCTECAFDEASGVSGMVARGNRYSEKDKFKIVDMEIKFGNVCNAGCIMCSSYNSSLLELELKENPTLGKFRTTWHVSPLVNWFDDPIKFKEVAVLASKCKAIRFAGGEPTVRRYLTEFLSIMLEHNTSVERIQITSNGSSFSKSLQTVLSKFKQVDINVSIDGYGAANDFIRWPIRWNKLERNVDKMMSFDNITVNVETSLQAASLQGLPDLMKWCSDRSIKWNAQPVYAPEFLQCYLASDEIIQPLLALDDNIITKLLTSNSVPDINREELRQKMIAYFDELSIIRNINWRDCFDV